MIHQLNETFVDSKFSSLVELCHYGTKSCLNRIPYYDKIDHPGKSHHLDEIHHLDDMHLLKEIHHLDESHQIVEIYIIDGIQYTV